MTKGAVEGEIPTDETNQALGAELNRVCSFTNDTLAGSALAAPRAGFGDYEQ